VSDSTLVVWDEVFAEYDFGASTRCARSAWSSRWRWPASSACCPPGRHGGGPRAAGDDLLELVHDPSYVAAVKRAPDDLMGRLSLKYGLGTGDVPVFAQMHEAAALVTGRPSTRRGPSGRAPRSTP
jgi:acetoin utilization protein AcuC